MFASTIRDKIVETLKEIERFQTTNRTSLNEKTSFSSMANPSPQSLLKHTCVVELSRGYNIGNGGGGPNMTSGDRTYYASNEKVFFSDSVSTTFVSDCRYKHSFMRARRACKFQVSCLLRVRKFVKFGKLLGAAGTIAG